MTVPNARPPIPLMRPLLVQHEYVIPYLRRIDGNRWYSNFGPLVQKLEERLAEIFETGRGSVVTTSNGTSGLTNVLRALDLPRGTLCLVPAWTFIATPAAAVSAGLIPYFIDVDEKTWMPDPEAVRKHVADLCGKVSAVMVVAPYGAPVDIAAWDAFTEETGIPVIIDAAAAFDACSSVHYSKPRKNPVVISMHATKMFGIGEGGMVISSNVPLISRVREMSNFGFSGERSIRVPGTNGKMSEYAAAVALATLDLWPQTREYWLGRKWSYLRHFDTVTALTGATPWQSDEWTATTFNIHLKYGHALSVIEKLIAAGIESRQWWGKGCHVHPAYCGFPRAPLPVTEGFGDSVLALPFNLDIQKEDIDYIMDTFCAICSRKAA